MAIVFSMLLPSLSLSATLSLTNTHHLRQREYERQHSYFYEGVVSQQRYIIACLHINGWMLRSSDKNLFLPFCSWIFNPLASPCQQKIDNTVHVDSISSKSVFHDHWNTTCQCNWSCKPQAECLLSVLKSVPWHKRRQLVRQPHSVV